MMLKNVRITFVGISVLLLLFMGACASGTVPAQKVAEVESAINRARESTAVTNAPLQLKLAVDKFQEARTMINQENYKKANLLLDEALVDAQLAEAMSRSEKEKNQAAKMRESVEAMRLEIERKYPKP